MSVAPFYPSSSLVRNSCISVLPVIYEDPLIEEFYSMLKIAEQNTINNVDICEKILHVTKVFEFVLNKNMLTVVNSKDFHDSVKTKIIDVTNNLMDKEIPYWISVRYYIVSTKLMQNIFKLSK